MLVPMHHVRFMVGKSGTRFSLYYTMYQKSQIFTSMIRNHFVAIKCINQNITNARFEKYNLTGLACPLKPADLVYTIIFSSFLCVQDAFRVKSDQWKEAIDQKAVWRFARTMYGGQYAIGIGLSLMLELCAENQDFLWQVGRCRLLPCDICVYWMQIKSSNKVHYLLGNI